MKRWIGLAVLVFVGVAGWRIGGRLSADALSMAVGVLFGVMAGVPAALLLMASGPRRAGHDARAEAVTEAVTDAVTGARRGHGWAHDARAMQPWQAAGQMPHAALPQSTMPQQPPVIVLATPQGMGAQAQGGGIPAGWAPEESRARRFKVVGEQEAWLDEW